MIWTDSCLLHTINPYLLSVIALSPRERTRLHSWSFKKRGAWAAYYSLWVMWLFEHGYCVSYLGSDGFDFWEKAEMLRLCFNLLPLLCCFLILGVHRPNKNNLSTLDLICFVLTTHRSKNTLLIYFNILYNETVDFGYPASFQKPSKMRGTAVSSYAISDSSRVVNIL